MIVMGGLGSPNAPDSRRAQFSMAENPMAPALEDDIRQLNDEADVHAHRFEAGGSLRLRWGFMCECASAHCTTSVEMSRAEYADLRLRGGKVLADDH